MKPKSHKQTKSHNQKRYAPAKAPHGKQGAFKKPAPTLAQTPVKVTGQILFGTHAVEAAWLNGTRKINRLYVTQNALGAFEGKIKAASKAGLPRPKPEVVEGKTLDKLTNGAVHQGVVLDAAPLPEIYIDDFLETHPQAHCLLVLDQVTDPHNVGAILRSACAFGVGAVLMTDRHAAAATGTLAKIASGALEVTPLIRVPNLAQALAKLQKEGFWCIGLAEEGRAALHEIKMPQKVALVMGAEGEGLRRLTRESCDELARLPTQPPIGSLNVSNAAAVAIYEIVRSRFDSMPQK